VNLLSLLLLRQQYAGNILSLTVEFFVTHTEPVPCVFAKPRSGYAINGCQLQKKLRIKIRKIAPLKGL